MISFDYFTSEQYDSAMETCKNIGERLLCFLLDVPYEIPNKDSNSEQKQVCVPMQYETSLKSGRDFFVKPLRIIQTLSYLDKSQILSRISYMFRRKFVVSSFSKDLTKYAKKEIDRLKQLNYTEITFNFLNKTLTFSPDKIKWESRNYNVNDVPERLWLYNLNYFAWLLDSNISNIAKQIAVFNWIEKNPTSSSEAWEPYPTSLRIVNWAKWLKNNLDNSANGGFSYDNISHNGIEIICKSIETQIERLFKDLEYHNLGNHLLANLCGIIIVYGLLYDKIKIDKEIKQYVIKELKKQLESQFLNDGAHIERCPSYHLEMLQMLTETKEHLVQSNEIELSDICEKIINKMQSWLKYVIHPNNTLAMFGDTTSVFQKFSDYVIDDNAIYLEDSGYFVYKTPEIYFVIKLVGPAPDYNPGHSHCDLLSYELSLGDEKIITDTGVGSYQNVAIRQHCRTSYSHNIPMIEHTEQSDIYSLFRIGKRAELTFVDYDKKEKLLTVMAKDYHNQIFNREIKFCEDYIAVHDFVENKAVTGTFISLVHKFADEQINNYKVEIFAPNHRISCSKHLIYQEFGKAQKVDKIVISNKEESEITYAITWKKA